MKILKYLIFFFCLEIILSQGTLLKDDQVQLEEDQNQIENLEKERKSYQKNKSFVETWFKFWKKPITEEDSYVQDNTNEVKINVPGGSDVINIERKPNLDDSLIDKHYTMDKNLETCEQLIEFQKPLFELERFYFMYNSQKGRSKQGSYPIDYMNKLNQNLYETVQKINDSERQVFKGVMLLQTSTFYIKSPSFTLQSFFYQDSTFEETEKMLLEQTEPVLETYYTQYMSQKEILIQHVSEVEGFVNNMNDFYQQLYEQSNQIYQYYRDQIEDAIMIKDITNDILRKMRKMFELRIKIIDQIAMAQQEFKSYGEIKPEIDRILGKATFLVEGLKEKQKNQNSINMEQKIKEDEMKQEQETSKREIQQKLDTGELKMSEIEDPDLANDLLKNPPKTKSNLVQEIKSLNKITMSIFSFILLILQ